MPDLQFYHRPAEMIRAVKRPCILSSSGTPLCHPGRPRVGVSGVAPSVGIDAYAVLPFFGLRPVLDGRKGERGVRVKRFSSALMVRYVHDRCCSMDEGASLGLWIGVAIA